MGIDATAQDTIAAIATPPGPGGVGIIRISGPRAQALARALFRSSRPGFAGLRPYRLHHGLVRDAAGAVLDEVLAAFMPGPGSYTGEDVVELHCHGGPAVLRAVLEAVMSVGARPAEPGEFTFRAWRNNRLDLTQAEAVAELIAAPSRAGLDLAQARLSGALGRRVRHLRQVLEDLRSGVCLAVDFPDEDAECLSRPDFGRGVARVMDDLRGLASAYERTRCRREGALAVLAGQVNAGKSSLLNALLGRERAIVADLPGTTRDYLEEAVSLDGLCVRLVDTAGLRGAGGGASSNAAGDAAGDPAGDPGGDPRDDPGDDPVEAEGAARSRQMAAQADLVLLVVDGARPPDPADEELAQELLAAPRACVLALVNKRDLARAEPDPGPALAALGLECLEVSARTGLGLEVLTRRMRQLILEAEAGPGAPGVPDAPEARETDLAPNLRQAQAIRQALDELEALAQDIETDVPYDLLGVRLETACALLSEITGDMAPQDVLESIFSRFCIGK